MRIDWIYISPTLYNLGGVCETHPNTKVSDHALVQLTLFSSIKSKSRRDSIHSDLLMSEYVRGRLKRAKRVEARLVNDKSWMDWVESAQKRVVQEAGRIKKEQRATKFRAKKAALRNVQEAEEQLA